MLHYQIEVRHIQFGNQVVQTQNRPFFQRIEKHPGLSQHTGQCHQFGLPARQVFARRCFFETYTPIGPVRPRTCAAQFPILVSLLFKRLSQGSIRIPAAVIRQSHRSQFRQQVLCYGLKLSCQHGCVGTADFVQRCARTIKLGFPDRKLLCITTISQQGIPLTQRPTIAAPPIEEWVFHVEHSPIHKTASHIGSAGNQGMPSGLETKCSALFQDGGKLLLVFAIQPELPPCMVATHA